MMIGLYDVNLLRNYLTIGINFILLYYW